MIINRNTLGQIEVPNCVLIKASDERVGILNCTAKSYAKKYNDMDTLSLEVPLYTDGELTPFYDDIDIMKYVEAPTVGTFAIKTVNIVNEGQTNEFKKLECQSRECELGQKYLEEFAINEGTTGSIDGVSFYNPGNQSYSLLHLAVAEKCPGWSFDHISASLWSMKRSFEVSRQDIYSFLMNDVAEAFECIFVFNSSSMTISAYTEAEYGKDIDIHVSYNNLLENTNLDYSIDEVKTCLTLKGDDDLDVREVAMGYDRIYNFNAYASLDYWSQSLLDAYNAWQTLIASPVNLDLFAYKTGVITRAELQGKNYEEAFTILLTKYQNYYTQISEWQTTKLPYGINTRKNPGYGTVSYTEDGSDAVTFERQTATQLVSSLPSSGNTNTLYLINNSPTWDMYRYNGQWVHLNHWYNCAVEELEVLSNAAQKQQATAMKAGYGDPDPNGAHYNRYIDTYLPAYYMYNALAKQIASVNNAILSLRLDQDIIIADKNIVTQTTSMVNNFTPAQLKELSTFIREDELSSNNYVVTDIMTEEERFEMLNALLAYGQKELAKVSTPQIQFSAGLVNLFAIPEFDNYSGDFDIGNYVWVTIRDDYSIKAKILEIDINFLDQSDFKVTFGNVVRKARNMFTDVTNALNAATAAATSVSFGASHWSAAAEQTDSIGDALSKGLLSQSYYLANAENNETRIDENGVWITTVTGSHGRENTDNYDAIYMGGGRTLYTSDGWRTVSMSTGRGDVQMPSINSSGQLIFTTESKFGVFADFLLAGYVGGSTIVGGDIYSSNYQTSSSTSSGNRGTHINLTDGTFEFNSKTTGKKRLVMSSDTLTMYGTIQASSGHIGCDDDGSGGFVIDRKSDGTARLYSGKSEATTSSEGVYVGTDSIALGTTTSYTTSSGTVTKSMFQVDKNGYLYASSANISGRITASSGTIGGFTITSSSLYNGKSSLTDSSNGVYIGTDGIALGSNSKFKVTKNGAITATSGNIGGAKLGSTYIGSADNSNWRIYSDGDAYFKGVHIDGVEGGSYFGGVEYNGSGYTYYDSNSGYPFQGNCVSHIESISADYIYANYLRAMQADIDTIEANYVTTTYLNSWEINANHITTGTLSTNRLNINGIVSAMAGKDFNIEDLEIHGLLEFANWTVSWKYVELAPGQGINYLGR